MKREMGELEGVDRMLFLLLRRVKLRLTSFFSYYKSLNARASRVGQEAPEKRNAETGILFFFPSSLEDSACCSTTKQTLGSKPSNVKSLLIKGGNQ